MKQKQLEFEIVFMVSIMLCALLAAAAVFYIDYDWHMKNDPVPSEENVEKVTTSATDSIMEYCMERSYSSIQRNKVTTLGYNKTEISVEPEETVDPKIIEVEEETEEVNLLPEKYMEAMEKYPVATYVFDYIYEATGSKVATLGIIGNMMCESGGRSLNLQATAYNKSEKAYGLCQWMKKYNPDVFGQDIDTQLQYLMDTIEWNFEVFGSYYEKGFTYEDFLNLDSVEEAAIAFAKVYEKCAYSEASYNRRAACAVKAAEYYGDV